MSTVTTLEEKAIDTICSSINQRFGIPFRFLTYSSRLRDDLKLSPFDVGVLVRDLGEVQIPTGVAFTIVYLGELFDWYVHYLSSGSSGEGWSLARQNSVQSDIQSGKRSDRPSSPFDPRKYLSELVSKMEKPQRKQKQNEVLPSTAIIFSGQGSQYVGMASHAVTINSDALMRFRQAETILGYPLLQYCRSEDKGELLNETRYAQPALFCASMAAFDVLSLERPEVLKSIKYFAGLSLGQYTALVAAGSMSFADALSIVAIRGREMQRCADNSTTGMIAIIGLKNDDVEALVTKVNQTAESPIRISNRLCPGNVVLAGENDTIDVVKKLATDMNAKQAVRLKVSGAFHTHFMTGAAEALREALQSIEIKRPTTEVIDNVSGCPLSDPAHIREALVNHLTSPVLWEKSLEHMLDQGIERFIEVGVGKILSGHVRFLVKSRKETKAIEIEQCLV